MFHQPCFTKANLATCQEESLIKNRHHLSEMNFQQEDPAKPQDKKHLNLDYDGF